MIRMLMGSSVFWALFFSMVFLSIVSLWQRDQMTRLGYGIERIEIQKKKMLELHKKLLIEVESLNALDRIEKIAVRQLSMTWPSPSLRIYVEEGLE